jgi:predicted DsbA family dithiol-disulfide isomerase
LHPETPAAGISLEDLFAGRNVDDIRASQARMRGLMAQEGLPYGQRTRTYNSRLAQELGKWADTQPDGARLHDALFRAYFVDNKNIGEIDTLVDIASSVGLPAAAARQVLETRQFQAAVAADWQRSRAFGITGVPTFVANGRGVVGAQPYEVLERLVLAAGGVPRQG